MSSLEATNSAMELTDESSHSVDGDNREDAFHRAREEAEE